MSDEIYRLMIEAGNLQWLQAAPASDPDLANKSISWFLNQKNESDPLHYISDCVFNDILDDARAAEIAALLIENGALIEGKEGRESPLIAATSLGTERVAKLLIDSGASLEATGWMREIYTK